MSKLSYYPNMSSEVLEAVHLMYEDHPDVEVDCLLYLSGLMDDSRQVSKLSLAAIDVLEDMGRCGCCGELLQAHHYQEPHPELDGCPMEDMVEWYCPHCDIPEQIVMEDWR